MSPGIDTAPASVDLAILGGGLAGGLIALALTRRRPEVRLALVEQARLGGNHVWSRFGRDVEPTAEWLVEPLVSYRWPAYDVAFPAHRRTLDTPYRSITSERFAEVLQDQIPAEVFVDGRVVAAEPGQLRLADGRRLAAAAVLDARGPGDLTTLDLGWQKFVGQTLHTAEPHGVSRPMVMDACVEQVDGYRFVYVLPFGPDEIFVEDTYYSDTPDMDQALLQSRILGYAQARGWRVTGESRLESGVLPVVLGGDFEAYWRSTGTALAKAGVRAGLFHPTTGYSLPDAVRLACLLAAAPDLATTPWSRSPMGMRPRPGPGAGSTGRWPPCCSGPPSRSGATRCWSGSTASTPPWCSASTPRIPPGPTRSGSCPVGRRCRSAVLSRRCCPSSPVSATGFAVVSL